MPGTYTPSGEYVREVVDSERRLAEEARLQRRVKLSVAVGAVSLVVFVLAYCTGIERHPLWRFVTLPLAGAATVASMGFWIISAARLSSRHRVREYADQADAFAKDVADARSRMRDTAQTKQGNAFFSGLELNDAQIRQYHEVTKEQASQSFRAAVVAGFIGLGVMVGGVAVAIMNHDLAWPTSALGAIGTAVSGYIGNTHLMVYRRSVWQLNHFLAQLLRNQDVMVAYQLSAELDDTDKTAMRKAMIQRIIDQMVPPNFDAGEPPDEGNK